MSMPMLMFCRPKSSRPAQETRRSTALCHLQSDHSSKTAFLATHKHTCARPIIADRRLLAHSKRHHTIPLHSCRCPAEVMCSPHVADDAASCDLRCAAPGVIHHKTKNMCSTHHPTGSQHKASQLASPHLGI
jgi:hypothetical protein